MLLRSQAVQELRADVNIMIPFVEHVALNACYRHLSYVIIKKGADDKILCICKSLKAIFSRWTTNNCYIMAVYKGIISVNEL